MKTPFVVLTHLWPTIVNLLFLLLVALAGATAVSAANKQPAEFAGSAQCVQCHDEIYADWQQSDHHKAMQPASQTTVLGDFNDVIVNFHGIDTRLFKNDGNYQVATVGKDGEPGVYTVRYTFGHYPLQQYLIDIGKGHLQALNVAWDSRPAAQGGQRWYHLQADEAIDPEHPFFWTRHFQNANSRCIEVAPDSANTNYAYGLLLVRENRQNEALKYFATAIEQEDATPRHIYVYAVALDSLGRTDAAIKAIDAASKSWPNNLDLSFLQVSYMDKTGQTAGIHRYLVLLHSVASNSPRIKAWIDKYGAGGGS